MITPQIKANKLAQAIGLKTPLYLKREDLHPYGSHKGRSIPLMIKNYARQGVSDFVISSSGNAALATAKYVAKHPKLKLTIFVGKNIDVKKELRIMNYESRNNIKIKKVLNPKQSAFLLDKTGKAKNLRQSTDNTALIGYVELARELAEIKNLSAVFVPTSSGTTAQGLYEGFKKLKLNPQIHIVQTDACHPMVKNSSNKITPYSLLLTPSIASAIVDKVAHRKLKILELLKNSHGEGWVVTNQEIKKAMEEIEQSTNIKVSPNSALSLVGLKQAIASKSKFSGPVVCLFTGR